IPVDDLERRSLAAVYQLTVAVARPVIRLTYQERGGIEFDLRREQVALRLRGSGSIASGLCLVDGNLGESTRGLRLGLGSGGLPQNRFPCHPQDIQGGTGEDNRKQGGNTLQCYGIIVKPAYGIHKLC